MKTIQALIIRQPYARPGEYYAKEVKAFITSASSRFMVVPIGTNGTTYTLYARKCGANVSSLLPTRRKLKRSDVEQFILQAERLVDLSLLDELPEITSDTETWPMPETERERERLRKIRVDCIDLVWPIIAPVGA